MTLIAHGVSLPEGTRPPQVKKQEGVKTGQAENALSAGNPGLPATPVRE